MKTQFSADRSELFAALAKAQAAMTAVKKDADNPFYKSKYATLSSCLEAIRQPFADNNLCLTQSTSNEGGSVTIETTIGHASGQWQCGTLTMTPERAGPQAMGACISYSRRYSLAAMCGLAQDDSDAEAATIHVKKGKKSKPADPQEEPKPVIPEKVWAQAEKAASRGREAMQEWFENTLTQAERATLKKDTKRFDILKQRANALSVSGAAKKAAAEVAA